MLLLGLPNVAPPPNVGCCCCCPKILPPAPKEFENVAEPPNVACYKKISLKNILLNYELLFTCPVAAPPPKILPPVVAPKGDVILPPKMFPD